MVERLSFRWSYVIAPLAVFLLSIILAAYFYHLLPPEVAVHFEVDGTPDRWLSREMAMVVMLLPQLFFVLMAGAITWGVTKLGTLFRQAESTRIKPEGIVSFMGNIFALPQLVLCFAMVDTFRYNSYQTHLVPMWAFLLAILGLVTIGLAIFCVSIFLKARD
jgi:uncharacterized membrane protein